MTFYLQTLWSNLKGPSMGSEDFLQLLYNMIQIQSVKP